MDYKLTLRWPLQVVGNLKIVSDLALRDLENEAKQLELLQDLHKAPSHRIELFSLGTAVLLMMNGVMLGAFQTFFAQNGVFYHPTLRFQFPVAPGWEVDNQKAAVVMAEPNGQALMGLRLAPEARARDAAAKFVQCAGAFDAEVTVLKDGQSVPGTSIMGLMMLAAAPGSSIEVSAEGAEAAAAVEALTLLVDGTFDED